MQINPCPKCGREPVVYCGEALNEYGGYNMPFRPHELGAIIDRAVELLAEAHNDWEVVE